MNLSLRHWIAIGLACAVIAVWAPQLLAGTAPTWASKPDPRRVERSADGPSPGLATEPSAYPSGRIGAGPEGARKLQAQESVPAARLTDRFATAFSALGAVSQAKPIPSAGRQAGSERSRESGRGWMQWVEASRLEAFAGTVELYGILQTQAGQYVANLSGQLVSNGQVLAPHIALIELTANSILIASDEDRLRLYVDAEQSPDGLGSR